MGFDQMVHVLAIITAKAGRRKEVLEALLANVPAVRREAGCIEYGAAVDAEGATPSFGPDTVVVIEKWASMDALKAHYTTPHMKAYAERVRDIVAGRAVHVLEPVSTAA
jgi:quinol monooxygenase YgiN